MSFFQEEYFALCVFLCFFFLRCIKNNKTKGNNLKHDTVILIYELFYILHQTFHEMMDSLKAVGLLLLLHHSKMDKLGIIIV